LIGGERTRLRLREHLSPATAVGPARRKDRCTLAGLPSPNEVRALTGAAKECVETIEQAISSGQYSIFAWTSISPSNTDAFMDQASTCREPLSAVVSRYNECVSYRVLEAIRRSNKEHLDNTGFERLYGVVTAHEAAAQAAVRISNDIAGCVDAFSMEDQTESGRQELCKTCSMAIVADLRNGVLSRLDPGIDKESARALEWLKAEREGAKRRGRNKRKRRSAKGDKVLKKIIDEGIRKHGRKWKTLLSEYGRDFPENERPPTPDALRKRVERAENRGS